MRKYIKLLIIPISLLLANCTSSTENSQSGGDSTTVDSASIGSGSGSPAQDSIKSDPPITNGQGPIPKDSN